MISFPSRDQIGLLPPSDETRTGAPGPGNGRTHMSSGGIERVADLFGDRHGLVDREGTVGDAFGKRRSVDELEHQRGRLPIVFNAVDAGDVRVIDGGKHLRLPPKAGKARGVVDERVREDLERDVAIELRVPRAVDRAHSSRANLRDDFIRADPRSGREGQSAAIMSRETP